MTVSWAAALVSKYNMCVTQTEIVSLFLLLTQKRPGLCWQSVCLSACLFVITADRNVHNFTDEYWHHSLNAKNNLRSPVFSHVPYLVFLVDFKDSPSPMLHLPLLPPPASWHHPLIYYQPPPQPLCLEALSADGSEPALFFLLWSAAAVKEQQTSQFQLSWWKQCRGGKWLGNCCLIWQETKLVLIQGWAGV